MKKRVISLSIDNKVYSEFSEFCNEKGWIISKQIENYMKGLLEKNN